MREDYPQAWQSADFSTAAWVRATPSELKELAQSLTDVITRFRERTNADDDDGEDREHAFVFVHGVPARP